MPIISPMTNYYVQQYFPSSFYAGTSKPATEVELTLALPEDQNPLRDYVSAELNPQLRPYNKKLRPYYTITHAEPAVTSISNDQLPDLC